MEVGARLNSSKQDKNVLNGDGTKMANFFIISIVYSQLEQFTVDVAILGYGWDENIIYCNAINKKNTNFH